MSGELTVRRADLGRSEPPRWAWSERIVLGYLNLLIGNEGVGKGTLIAWLIARLTRGELPGDLYGEPAGAAVIGDEDSFDGVWTPRLYAAGADLARVVQVERPDGGFVNLREDRDQLAAVVKGEGLAVLYFDQLLDNLGVEVDDWRTKQVREALQPLRSIARELNIAALGSLHPNKRGDTFRQLVCGAVAFNAVSRSSLLLAHHPDDQTRRVAVVGKGNLARRPASVEFVLAEHSFTANGHTFTVPVARDFATGAAHRRRPHRRRRRDRRAQQGPRRHRDHRGATPARRRMASGETDPRGVRRRANRRTHRATSQGPAPHRPHARQHVPGRIALALAQSRRAHDKREHCRECRECRECKRPKSLTDWQSRHTRHTRQREHLSGVCRE